MATVLMNLETPLMGEALRAAMHQNGDLQIIQEDDPARLTGSAFLAVSSVLLMEVGSGTRFQLEDRLRTCASVRRTNPGCKIALLLNENADLAVTEQVMQAKRDGLIDQFIYSSVSIRYMAALLETL